MGISALLKSGFSIIKDDKIILAPYLIFAFIISSLEKVSPMFQKDMSLDVFLTRYLLSNWAVELFFMGITISFAVSLYKKKSIDISGSLKDVISKYTQLIFATCISGVPAAFLAFKVFSDVTKSGEVSPVAIGALFLIVPISVFLMFSPMFVIIGNHNWLSSIVNSAIFVKKHFKQVLVFLSVIIFVNMMSYFLSILFIAVPIVGQSVFYVFFQGLGYTLVYILTVIFYLECPKNTFSTIQ